ADRCIEAVVELTVVGMDGGHPDGVVVDALRHAAAEERLPGGADLEHRLERPVGVEDVGVEVAAERRRDALEQPEGIVLTALPLRRHLPLIGEAAAELQRMRRTSGRAAAHTTAASRNAVWEAECSAGTTAPSWAAPSTTGPATAVITAPAAATP